MEVLANSTTPAGGTVDAVREAAKHVAGLVVFPADVFPREFHQGYIARAVALHQVAAAFVYGQQVIVLVEDLQVVLVGTHSGLKFGKIFLSQNEMAENYARRVVIPAGLERGLAAFAPHAQKPQP